MPIPNSAYGIILIDNLEVYKQYPIVYVRRIKSLFRTEILFTLRMDNGNLVDIVIPEVYAKLMKENDIVDINSETRKFVLISIGMDAIRSHILQMKPV